MAARPSHPPWPARSQPESPAVAARRCGEEAAGLRIPWREIRIVSGPSDATTDHGPSHWEDYATILPSDATPASEEPTVQADLVPVRTVLSMPDAMFVPKGRDRIYAALTAMGISWETLRPLEDSSEDKCCQCGGATHAWSSTA